jgi:hypothetical protein
MNQTPKLSKPSTRTELNKPELKKASTRTNGLKAPEPYISSTDFKQVVKGLNKRGGTNLGAGLRPAAAPSLRSPARPRFRGLRPRRAAPPPRYQRPAHERERRGKKQTDCKPGAARFLAAFLVHAAPLIGSKLGRTARWAQDNDVNS